MKSDGRLSEGGIGMVMAEDEAQAWDDTTGEELDAGMVSRGQNGRGQGDTQTRSIL